LSQALQSSDGSISTSMTLIKSTITGIKSFNFSAAQADMTDALRKLEQSEVQMTAGDAAGSEKAARQFITEIVSNLEMRLFRFQAHFECSEGVSQGDVGRMEVSAAYRWRSFNLRHAANFGYFTPV
jgi:hypothetical protein